MWVRLLACSICSCILQFLCHFGWYISVCWQRCQLPDGNVRLYVSAMTPELWVHRDCLALTVCRGCGTSGTRTYLYQLPPSQALTYIPTLAHTHRPAYLHIPTLTHTHRPTHLHIPSLTHAHRPTHLHIPTLTHTHRPTHLHIPANISRHPFWFINKVSVLIIMRFISNNNCTSAWYHNLNTCNLLFIFHSKFCEK